MKNLQEIMKHSSLDDLETGVLKSTEKLPYESDQVRNDSLQALILKYYEGTITKEEHFNAKSLLESKYLWNVYNNYIFAEITDLELFAKLQNVQEEEINKLIDIWLCCQFSEGPYISRLKKIMTFLYCQKQDKRFRKIALDCYESDAKVKEFVDIHREFDDLFLILKENDNRYGAKYAVKEADNKFVMSKGNEAVAFVQNNEEWIYKTFGK